MDKSSSKLHTRGFNAEVDNNNYDKEIKVSNDQNKNEQKFEIINEENTGGGGFDVPESNLDPDALSWE